MTELTLGAVAPSSPISTAGGATDADVKIALQLPNGERLMGAFQPSTSLGDILRHFAAAGQLSGLLGDADSLSSSDFAGCQMVYMRATYDSSKLASTTLASLGLTKGSVAFRAAYPTAAGAAPASASGSSTPSASSLPSPTVASADGASKLASAAAASPTAASASPTGGSFAVQTASSEAAVAAATLSSEGDVEMDGKQQGSRSAPPASSDHTAMAGSQDAEGAEPSRKRHKQGDSNAVASKSSGAAGAVGVGASSATTKLSSAAAPSSSSAATLSSTSSASTRLDRIRVASQAARLSLDRLRASAWDEDARTACSYLLKYLDAVLSRPGDPKVRTVKLTNAAFQRNIGRFAGGPEVLIAAGFTEAFSDAGEPCLVLFTPETHPASSLGLASADGMDADDRVASAVEDRDVVLTVRGAVAAELSSLGEQNVPPAPRPDIRAIEAEKAAVRAAAAAFDPFRSSVVRVSTAAEDGGQTVEVKPLAPVTAAGANSSSSSSAAVAVSSVSAESPKMQSPSASSSVSLPKIAVGPLPLSDPAAMLAQVPLVSAPAPLSSSLLASLTDTERKVARLKWRRAAIQASRAPSFRATTIVLFDASASAANPARFTADESVGTGIDMSAADADVDERDPEAARLLSEWARKKLQEAESEKVRHSSQCRIVFSQDGKSMTLLVRICSTTILNAS